MTNRDMTDTAGTLPVHLAKGGNIALTTLDAELGSVTVVLETAGREGRAVDADVSVLLLGDDRRVRSNDDLIFYNHPVALAGAVHLRDKIRTDDDDAPVSTDVVTLELDDVPDDVQRIVLSASLDPSLAVEFGTASAVNMRIRRSSDAAELLLFAVADLSSETALLFGEFYRRDNEWKVRAIGQGYDGGLAQLVAEFGIEVDQPDDAGNESAADSVTGPEFDDARWQVAPTSDLVDSSAPAATAAEPDTGSDDSTDLPTSRVSVRRFVRAPRLPADWDRTVPTNSDSDWQPARLFPVAGIGGPEEQERRATSALLAVMSVVKEFGRSIASRFGAPAGALETFIEVPFGLGDQAYRPDGVIRVTRGQRTWSALVEVKTSDAKLAAGQVDTYVDIARTKGIDAVLTISNQLTGPSDDHPVDIDRRKLKRISLDHLAWDQIRTEALLLIKHHKIVDQTQQRVLEEFVRYMLHPRSGLHGFTDMGPQWVKVREAAQARTLRATDKGCAEVTAHYDQLVRHVGLHLSSLLGVETISIVPGNRVDSTTRSEQLADSGQLFASIKVPGAVDTIVVTTDLRSERVMCSIQVDAPGEGRSMTRVNWLLRQIPDARDGIRVEALLAGGRGQSTAALLGVVRKTPESLLPKDGRDIRAFRISLDTPMGAKRGVGKGGLIGSVQSATTHFYGEIVQNLRPWNARPPKLQGPDLLS